MVICDASSCVSFASPVTSDVEVSVSAFATVFASLLSAADVSAICVESPAALSPEHPLSATVSVSNILAKRTFPNRCPLLVMSFTPFPMLFFYFKHKVQSRHCVYHLLCSVKFYKKLCKNTSHFLKSGCFLLYTKNTFICQAPFSARPKRY